jgi:hypothetical protein
MADPPPNLMDWYAQQQGWAPRTLETLTRTPGVDVPFTPAPNPILMGNEVTAAPQGTVGEGEYYDTATGQITVFDPATKTWKPKVLKVAGWDDAPPPTYKPQLDVTAGFKPGAAPYDPFAKVPNATGGAPLSVKDEEGGYTDETGTFVNKSSQDAQTKRDQEAAQPPSTPPTTTPAAKPQTPSGYGGGYRPSPNGGFVSTISPGARQEFEAWYQHQKEDIPERGLNMRVLNEQYRQLMADQAMRADVERENAVIEQQRQEKAKLRARDDYDAAAKLANEATIDPKRLFNTMGAAGTFASTIGVMLGAIGAGLTHTPNQALQILNSQIDRDIAAQEKDLDTKRGGAQNALARLRDQTGDLEAAKAMYRAASLQYAQAKMGEYGAAERNTAIMNATADQLSDLERGHAQYRMSTEARPAPMGGHIGLSKQEQGLVFNDPTTGQSYIARDDKSRERLANMGSALASMRNIVGQIRSLRPKISTLDLAKPGFMQSEDAQRLNQLSSDLFAAARKAQAAGAALSPREEKLIDDYTSNPTSMWKSDAQVDAGLDQLLKSQTNSYKSQLDADAVNVGESGFTTDAQGLPKPVDVYTGDKPQTVGKLPPSAKKVE